MTGTTPDQLGRYAEAVAWTELVRPRNQGTKPPFFRVTHLGDKYPVVDFLVDLLGPNDSSRGFFFVQIKGTTVSKPTDARLTVDVPKDRFNALAGITAPTYLIGVDLVAGVPYIVAAYRRRRARVSAMSKAFPLNTTFVKVKLFQEVLAFWSVHNPLRLQTGFKDV